MSRIVHGTPLVPGAGSGGAQAWVRPLANGDVAVALLNLHPNASQTVSLELREVVPAGCAPEAAVVDVWVPEAEGAQKATGTLAMSVLPHEARLLRLSFGAHACEGARDEM